MNTEVMFSSKTEMWETPQDFFDKLNEEFRFTLDVCATPQNAKCEKFYTPEQDGLSQPWEGACWCNPPYCRQTGGWVKKAYEESQTGHCTVVMLLPCRPDVSWFHDYILGKSGNPFYPRPAEIWRQQKQRSVPVNGGDISSPVLIKT